MMSKFVKFILILAAAGLISLGFQIGLTNQYADWVSADGVVTDIQFHHSSGGRHHGSSYSYEIYYSYTVDGKVYSGVNAYSGRETDTEEGQAVTVWYDPDNHEDASFHPPGPGLYTIVPFIFAFPLAMRVLLTKKQTKRGRKHRGNKANNR